MTDTNTNTDQDHLAGLREAARRGAEAEAENARLRRQLLFTQNGVDLDSVGGRMLLETWKDDNDPTTLVDLARQVNALKAPATTPPAEDPARPSEDARRQSAQDTFSGGQAAPPANEPTGAHPIDAAISTFRADVNKGQLEELAARSAFAQVLSQAGDKRLHFDAEAHLAAGREADRMFEGRSS